MPSNAGRGEALGSGPGLFERLKAMAGKLKREVEVYRLVLRDERTPWLAKLLLGAAVGYALMPIDLIPDVIPVLGHLDDALIVPGLALAGLKLVPKEILDDSRRIVDARHRDRA